MKTLLLAIMLTACGMETKDDTLIPGTDIEPANDELPSFTGWNSMDSATDTCSSVGIDSEMHCSIKFMAGKDNYPMAIFKFVAIKDGYMFVQTKNDVFVRQGQFHSLDFQEKPEVYRIDDKEKEMYQHYFYSVAN